MAKDDGIQQLVVAGRTYRVKKHLTDFTIVRPTPQVQNKPLELRKLSAVVTRAHARTEAQRDQLMDEVREEAVCHHVYQLEDGSEEVLIDNHICLRLYSDNPAWVEEVALNYHLTLRSHMGETYVLRVEEGAKKNPLKVAWELQQLDEVAECTPQRLMKLKACMPSPGQLQLFNRQWHLSSGTTVATPVDPTAGINVPQAWQLTQGAKEIVVAVMDDGFDLKHPAFKGTKIHPQLKDFGASTPLDDDGDPRPIKGDFHGTPVSSLIFASGQSKDMAGVSPGCTFLPIRVDLGGWWGPSFMLEVFKYVSQRADVVNCSFGLPPSSFALDPGYVQAMTQLTRTGGRKGKGLVIVFAAGNDDSPTRLAAAENTQGVRFVTFTDSGPKMASVPKGKPVSGGFPTIPGVVVVGAMSALKKKAGFSNWGSDITVVAPSNNGHYIKDFLPASTPGRQLFNTTYPGAGLLCAGNRPGFGDTFTPMSDSFATVLREDFYTEKFGGTSGAAPIVAGIVGLMLSVNPNLMAAEVRGILMQTADRQLNPSLDLANDPNLQGKQAQGGFVNGRSLFFGSGKVDAFKAVQQAQALAGPALTPTTVPSVALQPAADAVDQLFMIAWSDLWPTLESPDVLSFQIEGRSFARGSLWLADSHGTVLQSLEAADPAHALSPGTFTMAPGQDPPQVARLQKQWTELRIYPGLTEQAAWVVFVGQEIPAPRLQRKKAKGTNGRRELALQ